jgi:hypothetical protein
MHQDKERVQGKLSREMQFNHDSAMELVGFLLEEDEPATAAEVA